MLTINFHRFNISMFNQIFKPCFTDKYAFTESFASKSPGCSTKSAVSGFGHIY